VIRAARIHRVVFFSDPSRRPKAFGIAISDFRAPAAPD
jgi:hypothetical protein